MKVHQRQRFIASCTNLRLVLQDEPRRYCFVTSVVAENIRVVRRIIKNDHYVTYYENQGSLHACIFWTSIHSILHMHLAVQKLCFCWIPRNLSATQKSDSVKWCQEMLKNSITDHQNIIYVKV